MNLMDLRRKMDLIIGILHNVLWNSIINYQFYSNILNVIFYCIGYTIASPFVALMEIGIAGKNALIHRDLNLFQDKDRVYPLDGNHVSDAN